MKKILIFITIITFVGFYALSQNCATQQDCENGNGISTNPNNPINNNCPERRNNFDWRIQRTDGLPEDYIVYGPSLTYKEIQNPFTGPSGTPHFGNLTSNSTSDYQPDDGWELIKVDFGALSNFNTGWTQLEQDWPGLNSQLGGAKLPYMIMYNKYSGTFRFFGTLQMQTIQHQKIEELTLQKQMDAMQAQIHLLNK